jgi:nicotinamidase/pyrazinamidase
MKDTALLLIDVQNDFCPGGALPVDDGHLVVEPLNKVAKIIHDRGGIVIATQDWHPHNHCSFKEQGGPWPAHCIGGSVIGGVDLREALNTEYINAIIHKGIHQEVDSYSAFFDNDGNYDTGLNGMLIGLGIKHLFVGGLAADFCVDFSMVDARNLGYNVTLIKDGTKFIQKDKIEEYYAKWNSLGITWVSSEEF